MLFKIVDLFVLWWDKVMENVLKNAVSVMRRT